MVVKSDKPMIPEYTKRIAVRLSDTLHNQILEAVKLGKAKNPSELVRLALMEFFINKKEDLKHGSE